MTPSLGAAMQFFNIRAGQWSQDICDLVGIKTEQFSPIKPADAIIGYPTEEVTRLTGIGSQVPIVNGGQDHSAEAVTLGMTSAGDAWLGTGTAWVINGIMEEPAVERVPSNMSLNYHTLPQRWDDFTANRWNWRFYGMVDQLRLEQPQPRTCCAAI